MHGPAVDDRRYSVLIYTAVHHRIYPLIAWPSSRRPEVQCLNLHRSTSQDIPTDCMAKESTTGDTLSLHSGTSQDDDDDDDDDDDCFYIALFSALLSRLTALACDST